MMNGRCCTACAGPLVPDALSCESCGTPCDPNVARGFVMQRPLTRGTTILVDYDLVTDEADGHVKLGPAGTPLNLATAGLKIWFTVKTYLTDADQNAVAQATLVNGQVAARDVSSSGHVRITIPATATAFFPEGSLQLYYDLKVLDGLGRAWTVEKGLFVVDPGVTNTTS